MSWIGPKMRAPLPQRTKPLRAMSKKKRREVKQRQAVLAEVQERDGGCVARGILDHECSWRFEGHELIRRGQWGAGYLVVSNVVTLCHTAHRWVTEHPQEAVELGLAKWSWQR